jgi:SM-20-related protein
MRCDGLDAELGRAGLAIRDRFLTPRQVRELAECAATRRARGEFRAARIGANASLARREEVRGDSICWLDAQSARLAAPERALLAAFDELRLALNRALLLGLFELELHYAEYPPGAGYARHLDRPHGQEQRRVSLVLYLNEDWQPGDGGELRLFDADGGSRDIEPLAGRLVLFLTEAREHAVAVTRRRRLSLTGWLRSRA